MCEFPKLLYGHLKHIILAQAQITYYIKENQSARN
jgi:hypothetical protein